MIIVLVIRMLLIFTRKLKITQRNNEKKRDLHSLSVVEQEHRNRSGDDNTISNKTPHVRNLSKKQKSKDGGEEVICE